MEGRGGNDTYPECAHIPKAVRKEITEAQALELPHSKAENVLPLFERKVSDYKRMKLCSLETNEALKCRWNSYVHNIEGRTYSPFQFPNIGDLHFYNSGIKFMPSLTPVNRASFRRQMAIGPGVDTYGQIPIPCDMHVTKRTKSVSKAKTKAVKSSKAKKN